MPVTQDLLNKIADYEKQGYTPDEIVQGLQQSKNYPDVVLKIGAYSKTGYISEEILGGIKSSPIKNASSTPTASSSTTRGVTGTWDAAKNEIPELAGGVAGGLLAAKRSTPIGMALSGLGGAGGEAWKQVYQQITGSKDAPTTMGDAAKRIAVSGVTQAVGEGAGRALFAGASKAFAPFKKTITTGLEQADAILKNAMGKKTGLTPAQLTESHTLDVAESIAEQSWSGGQTIMDYRKLQSAGYKQMSDSILNDLNGYAATKATPEEVGLLFKDAKAAKNAVYKRLASIKYGKIDEFSEGVGVSLAPLKQSAQALMETASKRKGIGSTSAKDALLKKVLELDDIVTFKEAQAIRSGLMDEIATMSATSDIGKGMAKRFTQIIDKSMEARVKMISPEAYNAWREANQFYRGYKELFGNNFMRNLDKIADNAPEKVVSSIFQNGSITQIRNVKNIVKPKTFQKLKTSYTEQLFKNAEKEEGVIGGASLQNRLKKMGEPALREIYTSAELASINNFAKAGQALQKRAGGGGGMLIQLMQAGALGSIGVGLSTGNTSATASGATILIGPKVLAKMLLNPTTAKLLTYGFSIPAGSKAAMTVGSKLAATAAKIKLEEEDQK